MQQGLEAIREEAGRGLTKVIDTSEVLLNKSNINKLAKWVMKDVMKEELMEMTRLEVRKGQGKARVQEMIVKIAREFFLSQAGMN